MTAVESEVLYSEAFCLYENGKYDEAIKAFTHLAINNMRSFKSWMGLGASYQMVRNYKDALGAYAMAGYLNPTNPYIHFHAAECFFAINDREEGMLALKAAEEAIKDKSLHEELIEKMSLLKKGVKKNG
jgi:type III secretion system low calcium response chaperone LcrH/SycD